jgi:hypothetical protein
MPDKSLVRLSLPEGRLGDALFAASNLGDKVSELYQKAKSMMPMNAFAPRPMQSQMMPMGQNPQMPQQPGQQMMPNPEMGGAQPGMSQMRMAQPGIQQWQPPQMQQPMQPMPVNMPMNAFAPRMARY